MQEKALVDQLKKTLVEFYGENPEESKDVSRMINERHTKRVADLLEDKNIQASPVQSSPCDLCQRRSSRVCLSFCCLHRSPPCLVLISFCHMVCWAAQVLAGGKVDISKR